MEQVDVVGGQTVFKEGEKPAFFFYVKSGSFKVGNDRYSSGSFVAIIEYLLDIPMNRDVVAEEDSTIVKYTDGSVSSNQEEYENVLMYMSETLNASLLGEVDRDVIVELEKSVDVAKIIDLISTTEHEDEILEAIEDIVTMRKLPELPDEPDTAFSLIEKLSKEEDIMKYILHMIAFARKFPDDERSKKCLEKALEVLMNDLMDMYGAKYVVKLGILLYPEDGEMLRNMLLNAVRIMRRTQDPEWFDYLERLMKIFHEEEVRFDEIS